MAQRILTIVMVLSFVVLTIIGVHYLLDDLKVTVATSERTHGGDPVFVVLDILCTIVCIGGVAVFISLLLAINKPSVPSGLLPRRWAR